jgi:hypothetical protein
MNVVNRVAVLLKLLADAGDPRVTGDGQTFERPPFTDAEPAGPAKKAAARAARKQGS